MKRDSNAYKMTLLGILCAVCGLLLSLVNSVTAPVIAENNLAKVKENLEVIFPGGDFEDVSDTYLKDDSSGLIDAIYVAKGEGTIFTVHGTGYNSSGLTFMVGFDTDGTIVGFMALEQNETAGIGSAVFEDPFASSYVGIAVGDDIPMKSGATLTSTAVKNGIEAAQAMLDKIDVQ
jgi:electron transport complex protein RnfG